jgi:excisionase family DNA binding protein
MEGFFTTRQAAEKLGVTDAYVRQLILSGKLKAVKAGRDHLIAAAEVEEARKRKTTRGPARKSNEKSPAEHKTSKKKRTGGGR